VTLYIKQNGNAIYDHVSGNIWYMGYGVWKSNKI